MTVGTTAVKVLDTNPKRRCYDIVNNGSATIYLGADQGVTVDSGEPLLAGEKVSDDMDDEAVYAISAAVDQDIRVTEILKRE